MITEETITPLLKRYSDAVAMTSTWTEPKRRKFLEGTARMIVVKIKRLSKET